MIRLTCVLLLALAACRDTVAPRECTSVTQKGGAFHPDTTVTRCR